MYNNLCGVSWISVTPLHRNCQNYQTIKKAKEDFIYLARCYKLTSMENFIVYISYKGKKSRSALNWQTYTWALKPIDVAENPLYAQAISTLTDIYRKYVYITSSHTKARDRAYRVARLYTRMLRHANLRRQISWRHCPYSNPSVLCYWLFSWMCIYIIY